MVGTSSAWKTKLERQHDKPQFLLPNAATRAAAELGNTYTSSTTLQWGHPHPGSLNGAGLYNTSLRKRRKTLRNIRNLKPGWGQKPHTNQEKLVQGGKMGGEKKSMEGLGRRRWSYVKATGL